MIKFEPVSKYPDAELPVRKTANSAGYDFTVAEDIVIPSYYDLTQSLKNELTITSPVDLDWLARATKHYGCKPTLVPTGVKCHLNPDTYLELSVRSSTPLKYWLILANGVGIIDADYCDNVENEGHVFFQLINLSPFPIQLRKGDVIGQGIVKHYLTTDDDAAAGQRIGGFGSTGV